VTLLELLLAMALAVVVATTAVPVTAEALDDVQTRAAARYLGSLIVQGRMHAVGRGACVGFRFSPAGTDYQFVEYADGNGNGLRSADIASTADPQLSPPFRLRNEFRGVTFGLLAGVPDLDDRVEQVDGDGVRIGTSRILSLGPDGTATSGSLYLHGRRVQYAVRILGATARARLFRFERGSSRWVAQ